MNSIELRFQPTEFQTNDDGELVVSGYVNKTNQPSEILGSRQKFIEKIKPGTFKEALENQAGDIDFLAEHDAKRILASTRNNSLSLIEDKEGLYMEAVIAPTSWGKDVYTLIQAGILRNMSFGFKVLKDSWKKSNNILERTIEKIQLFEVSVVKNPAYSQSTIEARGLSVVADVEIPYELDEEKQMEKIIELIEALSVKVDGVAEQFNSALAKFEVRQAPEDEKAPEEETVEEPVKKDEQASTEEQEVEERAAKKEGEPKKEDKSEEDSEEKPSESDDEDGEKEPEEDEKPSEKRSLSHETTQELDSILSKLNQLKQGE